MPGGVSGLPAGAAPDGELVGGAGVSDHGAFASLEAVPAGGEAAGADRDVDAGGDAPGPVGDGLAALGALGIRGFAFFGSFALIGFVSSSSRSG